MGMEVEAAPVQVKVADAEVPLFQDTESKATAKEREEAAVFGADNGKVAANATNDLAPPKDAVEDWPEPKQTYTFYFVKIRSFEDPKLRAKLEQADKDFQNKIQARSKIFEAIKAKKTERSAIIAELKPLSAENRQYNEAFNVKLKEIEPFRNRLGKFRDENISMRAESAGLCSSLEELEQEIKRLEHRIAHESIPFDEEKRLIKEIKNLEKTRPKVSSNAAKRAKLQDTVVERDAIQDQVKIIGEGLDGVKKDRQEVRSKIKVLEDELKIVDAEYQALQEDLDAATARKDKAYDSLNELRKARDANNASFYQNRNVLNRAREHSSRSEVEELQELQKTEVEKFMTEWCGSKAFREDYEKRTLTSLNGRQLTRDGRMRNPDEKPIFIETHQPAPPVVQEPIPSKVPSKPAKEAVAPQAGAPKDEPLAKASAKVKAAAVADDVYEAEPAKEKPKPKEVDVAKLKEIKRQEEIEKNKIALERKKKQAEKQAAKAAARAQKEAEKKLKKEEKKIKKKNGETDEPTDSDTKSDEAAETQAEEDLAPVSVTVNKEQKERVRSRSAFTKSKAPLPKAILKRKKAQSYWSWATPAAAMAAVAVLVALLAVLGYYQYYRPASTSN
ncbi:proton pump-interactor BIP103 [Lolium perenne]|uniref:proton pump-interactor BIP103 n=1 Tax=Lolium perenne TaxID=4522 RepID=UPI0021F693BC|nr:proton pump-interactor BIP103 [Lolium perenne]